MGRKPLALDTPDRTVVSAAVLLLLCLFPAFSSAQMFRTFPAPALPESPAEGFDGTLSPPLTLRLATGSVGGTFLPVGHELAAWLEASIPGLTVVVDTTAGSVDNLRRLVHGGADLAIVGSSPYRGVLEESGRMLRGASDLCLVGTLYVDAEQYVVRTSMVRAGSMLDLNGLRMYPGPHQSGGEVDTRNVLETLRVEPNFVYPLERDKGYAEAAEALAAGEYDACTFSGGVPISALTRLLEEHPGQYRILPFTRHQLSKIRHAELDFEPVVIPAGSYPGQPADIVSVGGPNLLVASPSLGERLIRRIDRAVLAGIVEAGAGLRAPESHAVLRSLSPDLWGRAAIGTRCEGTTAATAAGRAP